MNLVKPSRLLRPGAILIQLVGWNNLPGLQTAPLAGNRGVEPLDLPPNLGFTFFILL